MFGAVGSIREGTSLISMGLQRGIYLLGVELLVAAFSAFYGEGTNNEAELTALRDGLKLCHDLGLQHFDVERDSMIVVNAIKLGTMVNWRLIYLWRECLQLMGTQRSRINHVFRQANGVADRLAAWAYEHRTFKHCFSMGELPDQVKQQIRIDTLGLWTYRG